MDWDVKTVESLSEYRIRVEMVDGRVGVFDMKPYLGLGAFQEPVDVAYFNQVGMIFLGAVTWPHEQDIAPETLLAEMVPAPHHNLEHREIRPSR
jgi:hypothetical protein